jgi:hypothetical protein
LTGDKKFANNEFIANRDGSTTATIIINTLGDVYTKGMTPLYVENITDVQRTAGSSESFKLIVKV